MYFEYFSLNRALPNRYTPSLALAWDGNSWAYENGYERVSFGQQKYEPANPRFRYKSKFGAEHVPLHARLVMLSATSSALFRMKHPSSVSPEGSHLIRLLGDSFPRILSKSEIRRVNRSPFL